MSCCYSTLISPFLMHTDLLEKSVWSMKVEYFRWYMWLCLLRWFALLCVGTHTHTYPATFGLSYYEWVDILRNTLYYYYMLWIIFCPEAVTTNLQWSFPANTKNTLTPQSDIFTRCFCRYLPNATYIMLISETFLFFGVLCWANHPLARSNRLMWEWCWSFHLESK